MKLFTSFALFSATMAISSFVTTDAFVPRSLQQQPKTSSIVLSSSYLNDVEGTTDTNGATGSTMGKTVASAPRIAQRWRKSTKQLATLGPASSDREMIEKLFLAGADVFRLNFSHGSQEQKKELLDTIRSVEEQYSHPIAALGDLQGPKLRVRFLECMHVCSRDTLYQNTLCVFYSSILLTVISFLIHYFISPTGWRILQ